MHARDCGPLCSMPYSTVHHTVLRYSVIKSNSIFVVSLCTGIIIENKKIPQLLALTYHDAVKLFFFVILKLTIEKSGRTVVGVVYHDYLHDIKVKR